MLLQVLKVIKFYTFHMFIILICLLRQRFSNFFEVGTTFLSQNSSLLLFPSKVNLSILIPVYLYTICHVHTGECTTCFSENSSTDHLTLVPFQSKFISFVAYFNTSILIYNLLRSIIVQYVTISMCRLGVGKTINNDCKI